MKFVLKLKQSIITALIIFVIPAAVFSGYALKANAQAEGEGLPENYEYDPSLFDPLDCTPLSTVLVEISDDVCAPQALPESEYGWWEYVDKDRDTMLREYEDAVATALAGISPSWTDEQKLCYLHDYICMNAEYDDDQADFGNNPISQSAYGNLVLHKSVCDGFARAFYDLANRIGIKTYDVVGDQMNHAWNLVSLNGKYYYVDCTFDEDAVSNFGVCHNYFLLSQSKLSESHPGTDWKLIEYYNIGIYSPVYIYGKYDYKEYDEAFWRGTRSQLIHRDGYSIIFYDDGFYKYTGNPDQCEKMIDLDLPYGNNYAFPVNDKICILVPGRIECYDEAENDLTLLFMMKEGLESDPEARYSYILEVSSIDGDYIDYNVRKFCWDSEVYPGSIFRSGTIDCSKKEQYFSPVYDEEFFLNELAERGIEATWYEDYGYLVLIDKETSEHTVRTTLLEYFYYEGMKAGMQGNKSFDLEEYKKNNKDLCDEFGDDNRAYYFHYLDYGKEAGRVAKPDTPVPEGSVLLHRMYNPNSGEHFYTDSATERYKLIISGWIYEGDGWIAPEKGDPVYRLYNKNVGDHHYTMSARERDKLIEAGWDYEGIGWYSAPKVTGTPLYRLYNPNCTGAGSHHYTTSEKEKDKLVGMGWKYEGIGWYGQP